ncbi:MAG: DUF4176 domain-containing protein [Pseudobutyrivibrio sp.]|nr:DUF4176 domain-containing protein [Pseudobutyrivibrio sp.]
MQENNIKKLYANLVESYGFSENSMMFLKGIYPEMANDIEDLYVAYSVIKNRLEQPISIGDVEINCNADKVDMTYASNTVSFYTDEFKHFLAQTITILEGILPQGTLVELDLEKIKVPNPYAAQLYVVITKRFLGDENGPFYQYGGELYPTGNYGTGKIISFTPATIKRIVHMGYLSLKMSTKMPSLWIILI